jgi:hypothetical protein
VPGRVGIKARMRRRAAAAALIEQHDIVPLGIEQAAMRWGTSRTRAAVKKHRRLAPGVAAALLSIIENV